MTQRLKDKHQDVERRPSDPGREARDGSFGSKAAISDLKKGLSYMPALMLRPVRRSLKPGAPLLPLLSQPRRQRRSGEWTSDRAVTFIVTLAATRSVTLAARRSGMSRKSAYALKARDPAFSAAWMAAAEAGTRAWVQGDKVEEVHEPPVSTGHGNTSPSRRDRERAFVRLVSTLRESPPLAPRAAAQ